MRPDIIFVEDGGHRLYENAKNTSPLLVEMGYKNMLIDLYLLYSWLFLCNVLWTLHIRLCESGNNDWFPKRHISDIHSILYSV